MGLTVASDEQGGANHGALSVLVNISQHSVPSLRTEVTGTGFVVLVSSE